MKKYLIHTQIAPLALFVWVMCLLVPNFGQGQTYDYGNAWYNPNTSYLQFKVTADGIYRVSAQQLINAGFDTSGVAHGHLHLLYRGEEEYIYVDTFANGTWNYLEFFGRRNDGALDTLMYVDGSTGLADGSLHPNPHVSTYSDTSVYYFYADNQPGLRIQDASLATVPLPVEIQEITKTSLVEYLPNIGAFYAPYYNLSSDAHSSLNCDWTWGEGYVGQNFYSVFDLILRIPTPHALNSSPAKIQLRMESMDSWSKTYEISVDGHLLLADSMTGYFVKNYELAYPFPLGDTAELQIHVIPNNSPSAGNQSFLNVAAITYPAATILNGGSTILFPTNNSIDVYYKFHDITSGTEAVAYDLVHHVRSVDTIHGDSLGIWIEGQSTPGLVFLSADVAIGTPLIAEGKGSNLSATSNSANMVLITTRPLASSAQAYQAYRQGSSQNPLNVRIAYTDEIYTEFGYGSPHPLAIKRFCKYALDEWAVKPDYFLIWGNGKIEIRGSSINHVPAYGFPFSDQMYMGAFHRDSLDYRPAAAIGRVPLETDQQGHDYLEKLSTYEETPDTAWMRNGIFSSGAADSAQLALLTSSLDQDAANFRIAPTLGRTLEYHWLDSTLVDSATISQYAAIDQGAALVWMISPMPGSMNFGDPALRSNQGKLPIIIGQTCFFGPTGGQNQPSFAEEWIMEPMKGAIATLGYSSKVYFVPVQEWGAAFSHQAFVEHPGAPLGELVREMYDSIPANWTSQIFLNHFLSMNLLGDPSIHFRSSTLEVWPGDANDDLIANVHDLLNIGLAYGDTGAARPNASIAWTGQTAVPWDSTFTNGTNHAHADCDGSGQVNALDTLAISQNYGLTHNKFHGLLGGAADDPELMIETVGDTVQDSSHLDLYLRLGTLAHPADSVYGLAAIIDLGPDLLDSASTVVSFDSCWMGVPGQNLLTMVRYFHALGQLHIAITRTDHQPISGEGIIARIGIVVIDNISGKMPGDTTVTPFVVMPVEAQMVNPAGENLPLQGIAKQLYVLGEVAEPALPVGKRIAIFPNPTQDEVYVQTASESPAVLSLYDAAGKKLLEQHFSTGAYKRLSLENLGAGIYVLKVANAEGVFQVRVTKMD